ncbi:redoxin domain-containing protein [Sphingobacterium hungaricum]
MKHFNAKGTAMPQIFRLWRSAYSLLPKNYSFWLAAYSLLITFALLLSIGLLSKAYGQTEALKIGDSIPQAIWEMPLSASAHPQGKEQIRLKDYAGKKLLILDFWATWCAPCIRSLHGLDSLSNVFGDSLAVIPVSDEPADKVAATIQARGWSLFSVYGNTSLRAYFPFRTVPHQLWIRDGKLLSIPLGAKDLEQQIRKAIAGHAQDIEQKEEQLDYSYKENLSRYASRTGSKLFFSSFASEAIKGIPSGTSKRRAGDKLYINYSNMPLASIYADLLAIPMNRLLIQSDSIDQYIYKPSAYLEKLCCYQLIADKDMHPEQLKAKVLQDLSLSFGLKLDSALREQDFWLIYQLDGETERDSVLAGPSTDLPGFVDLLNFHQLWQPDLPIYSNEAVSQARFPSNTYTLFQQDPSQLRILLRQKGLGLRSEQRQIKLYILTESNTEKSID